MAREADWLACMFLFVVPAACAVWYHMSRKWFLVEVCEAKCSVRRGRDRYSDSRFVNDARQTRDADLMTLTFSFVVPGACQ